MAGGAIAQDDTETHNVTVEVEDSNGTSLSGAEVDLDGTNATTDENGTAEFTDLSGGSYNVTVSHADESEDLTGNVTVDAETTYLASFEDSEISEVSDDSGAGGGGSVGMVAAVIVLVLAAVAALQARD